MTDIVYIVRPGDDNEELRYSLRSLTNLPHARVWIAGHKPAWVTGVEHIPTEQNGRKWANALGNLTVATTQGPESFVLFNDDFYVVEPIDEVPVLHWGTIRQAAKAMSRAGSRGRYLRGLMDALRLLEEWGHSDPLCYSLHTPLPVHGPTMAEVIERLRPHNRDGRLHLRTVYGNVAGIGGTQVADCKIRPPKLDTTGPFLSTADRTFPYVADHLRDMFPDPSPYEVA